jgi:thiol-disulfide isomerase/thioredoxin
MSACLAFARMFCLAAPAVFLFCRLTALAGEGPEGTLLAPGFSVRDIRGVLITSDSLLAHGPLLVDFWATWCAPCMAEFKSVKRLYDKYNNGRLKVLAVSEDGPEEIEKVKQTVAMKKMPYLVVIDNGKELAAKFQVAAVPALFLIGTDGHIKATHRGFISGDEAKLEKELRGLLGTK